MSMLPLLVNNGTAPALGKHGLASNQTVCIAKLTAILPESSMLCYRLWLVRKHPSSPTLLDADTQNGDINVKVCVCACV